MRADPILEAFARIRAGRRDAPLAIGPGRSFTVREIGDLATRIGAVIDTAGPCASGIVALAAPNGPAFLAAILALRTRGAIVALLDARTPETGIRNVCRVLAASALLRCGTGWERSPRCSIDRLPAPHGSDGAAPPPETAFIKLTSGSTGEPRGICASAAAIAADEEALFRTMALRPEDRLVAAVPMSHSYGFTTLAITALVRGAPLVFAEEGGPFSALEAATYARATVFPTSPAYIHTLLRLSGPPLWPRSVRLVISAGAPLQPSAATEFRKTFGLPVHVFYGASEAGGICYDRGGVAGERGTVGEPVEGVRVSLGPEDESAPAREGADTGEGRVTVVSPAVGLGYYPVPDPRLLAGRFLSGDVARWQVGELKLCGRSDDLVKIRGKLVSPLEVDGILSRLEGVEESYTLALMPPGGTEPIVRSIVACRQGALDRGGVLEWCRRHLPDHKVPRSIVIVREIPRTDRGKIDRAALARLEPEPLSAPRPPTRPGERG